MRQSKFVSSVTGLVVFLMSRHVRSLSLLRHFFLHVSEPCLSSRYPLHGIITNAPGWNPNVVGEFSDSTKATTADDSQADCSVMVSGGLSAQHRTLPVLPHYACQSVELTPLVKEASVAPAEVLVTVDSGEEQSLRGSVSRNTDLFTPALIRMRVLAQASEVRKLHEPFVAEVLSESASGACCHHVVELASNFVVPRHPSPTLSSPSVFMHSESTCRSLGTQLKHCVLREAPRLQVIWFSVLSTTFSAARSVPLASHIATATALASKPLRSAQEPRGLTSGLNCTQLKTLKRGKDVADFALKS